MKLFLVTFVLFFFEGLSVCPSNWTMVGGQCFRISDESFSEIPAANAYCNSLDSTLASVHSREQLNWIHSVAKQVWLGGYRRNKSNDPKYSSFSWMDGSPFDFSSWQDGEPNNFQYSQNCIVSTNGYFDDYFCINGHDYQPRAVCSIEPNTYQNVEGCPSTTTWSVYNGVCYKFDSTLRTSTGANTYCQSIGGKLASIPDSGTNSFFKDTISKGNTKYWIGGYRLIGNSNSFMWLDGTQFIGSTFWAPNDPNNMDDKEKCTEFTNAGMWNDLDCELTRGTICSYTPRRKIPSLIGSCKEGTPYLRNINMLPYKPDGGSAKSDFCGCREDGLCTYCCYGRKGVLQRNYFNNLDIIPLYFGQWEKVDERSINKNQVLNGWYERGIKYLNFNEDDVLRADKLRKNVYGNIGFEMNVDSKDFFPYSGWFILNSRVAGLQLQDIEVNSIPQTPFSSISISNEQDSSVTTYLKTGCTNTCSTKSNSWTYVYAYQWVVKKWDGTATVKVCKFVCRTLLGPPTCPLKMCRDSECESCLTGTFKNNEIDTLASLTKVPTNKPTKKPTAKPINRL